MRKAPTIIGCVGVTMRSRLRLVAPTTQFCDNVRDLEQFARASDRAVVLADPGAFGGCADAVLRLHERYPSVPIVIYTRLDPARMQDVVRLARAGITDLVLVGVDDGRARIEQLVEDLTLAGVSLAVLEPCLVRVPEPLRRAIEEMFQEPRRFRSTLDLAAAAEMSPRATFRHLKAAGFRSARRLVASARVLRAYELLQDGGRSVYEVANRLGYLDADQVTRHLQQLGRCRAIDVRRGAVPGDFAAMVLASLLARPAGDRALAGAVARG